jgi:hypothetical protein
MADAMTDQELDAFAKAGLGLLGLSMQAEWLPGVRANLRVSLALAALVDEFALPDEAEPAPVFAA